MNIKTVERVKIFRISGVPALDPITVVMEDIGPHRGLLIIECYGKSWSAYWGAMGSENLRDFLSQASAEYIAGKMTRPREIKKEQAYLLIIVEAVKAALQEVK